MKDFYEENDRMEEAIAQALIDFHMNLEFGEEVPSVVREKAEEIIDDWDYQEEIKKTDELHNDSLNNATGAKILSFDKQYRGIK